MQNMITQNNVYTVDFYIYPMLICNNQSNIFVLIFICVEPIFHIDAYALPKFELFCQFFSYATIAAPNVDKFAAVKKANFFRAYFIVFCAFYFVGLFMICRPV